MSPLSRGYLIAISIRCCPLRLAGRPSGGETPARRRVSRFIVFLARGLRPSSMPGRTHSCLASRRCRSAASSSSSLSLPRALRPPSPARHTGVDRRGCTPISSRYRRYGVSPRESPSPRRRRSSPLRCPIPPSRRSFPPYRPLPVLRARIPRVSLCPRAPVNDIKGRRSVRVISARRAGSIEDGKRKRSATRRVVGAAWSFAHGVREPFGAVRRQRARWRGREPPRHLLGYHRRSPTAVRPERSSSSSSCRSSSTAFAV